MLHPIDRIKLPDILENFFNHVQVNTDDFLEPFERVWQITKLFPDFSPTVLNSYFTKTDYDFDDTPELLYDNVPFEIVPFMNSSEDGISFAWVNLAPELELRDYSCVFYHPMNVTVTWIGDNTMQALASILLGYPDRWQKMNIKAKLASPKNMELMELLNILSINIDECHQVFAGKSRNGNKIRPVVPAGYKYEEACDGIGVMAESHFFSGENQEAAEGLKSIDYLEQARVLLNRDHHASALLMLKKGRSKDPENLEIIHLICQVYENLGRESHANRVKLWLARRD